MKVNFNKIHLSSRLLQQHNWLVVSNTCLFPITYGIIHQLLTNSYFSRWLKVKPPTRHSVVNQWSNYIKLQFWFVFTSPIFYNNTIIRSRHGESPASFAETQVDEGFPETALPTQGDGQQVGNCREIANVGNWIHGTWKDFPEFVTLW